MNEKFSEQSYRRFLESLQNLFGKWDLVESVPLNEDASRLTIHECWIYSREEVSSSEWFRINVQTRRHLKQVFVWPFDYEWQLSLETSTGRSVLGLGVQLGAWLLAMRSFRFLVAIDRDSSLKDEPTEFRTVEAGAEHARRVLQEPIERFTELRKRGIVDDRGFVTLPERFGGDREEENP